MEDKINLRKRKYNLPTLDSYSQLIDGKECQICSQDLSGLPIEYYDHEAGWDVKEFPNKQWLFVTCLDGHKNSLKDLGFEPGVYYDEEFAEAAENGDVTKVKELLEAGIDPNARDIVGTPVLVCAAWRGHLEIIELLLVGGANINDTDSSGGSALYVACREGYLEIVERLLEKGADVNMKMKEGAAKTPLMIAIEKGHQGLNTHIGGHPIGNGHSGIVSSLLKAGADVNVRDSGVSNIEGSTPLMKAAEMNSVDIVEDLLAHGADVNAKATHGATALHIPSYEGYTDVVRLLLQSGANPNIKDSNGMTALDYAESEGNLEIAEMLRNRHSSRKWWQFWKNDPPSE